MGKKKPRPAASQALREAIKRRGVSLYRVAKDSGVGYASLHRFMKGERSISLDVFDRLCDSLGLELVERRG
jgi:transcriptional regulator with XRE-family HTH domain